MEVKYLVNPNTHSIAATVSEDKNRKSVEIHEEWITNCLNVNGITVPRNFAQGKPYIFPSDDSNLFAKAFVEHFFPHGLMQKGYFWKNQEDFVKKEEDKQQTLNRITEIFRRYM